jgi:crotonobetainyl-CoA:carnitine CoA-transferase CaiB-like acyl-CoA transferase
VQPLQDTLVVDLTRYLPGAFASRELLRLGARVVRVEPPDGDPMRHVQAEWHDELNAGKESVVCDLKLDPEFGRALCRSADVVLESFRPGVSERLGLAPGPRTVWCSITGFGSVGRHAARAGHDLNYLGWAGVLDDAVPPVPVADYAGAYAAVREVLAGLLERERTGSGVRREVSLTHESHALAAPPILRGTVACYRLYTTADDRLLTVAALETRFWIRLCELVGLPELAERQWEPRLPEIEHALAQRPLAAWLELFDGEDICAGPVATRDEAQEFARASTGPAPALGAQTAAWRERLGL